MERETAEIVGEIGYNVPRGMEEKEEDLLEMMYLWWREGRPLTVIDMVIETGAKKREVTALIKRMVRHGYVKEPDGSAEVELTDLGKGRGGECAFRHEKLTHFFRMISGMDEEEAGEDACRVEHVISRKGMEGIGDFLKYGDVYDRVVKNPDFLSMYGEGSHRMCMGIYYAEKRQPRILAREFEWFEDEVILKVDAEGGFFVLRPAEEGKQPALWYRKEELWERAPWTEEGCVIPARIFTYTISAALPVIEGTAMVAFPGREQRPAVMDCREMNVHLW